MNTSSLFRTGGMLALAGIAACSETAPVTATLTAPSASFAKSAVGSEERVMVSPRLAEMNAQLANVGAKVRVAKAEVLMNNQWNGVSSTLIIANDRFRGIGAEWVKGDPLRNGRTGVTYQIASHRAVLPRIINADRQSVRGATAAELEAQLIEGTNAWRRIGCSTAPITRIGIPAGTDPDFVDNFFSGRPLGPDYVQTADIVQGGWQSRGFFRNIGQLFYNDPAVGDNIIGITFTFTYVDAQGRSTDVDRNGKEDIGLAEVFYNAFYVWDNSGIVDGRVVDFYSIISHETGHALGLGHFGKVFITGPDVADGTLSLSEVKYAPYATMNAVYIAGRNELAGTDHSSFCQLWASDNVRLK